MFYNNKEGRKFRQYKGNHEKIQSIFFSFPFFAPTCCVRTEMIICHYELSQLLSQCPLVSTLTATALPPS